MTQEAIFLPVTVLALLTIAVLSLVPLTRGRSMKAKRTHIKDFRYGESQNVPGDVSLPNRDYMNLLELPVLFYVLALALYATKKVDETYIMLAWGFVAARIAHSIIHLSYNNVIHRFYAFGLGLFLLVAMWLLFALSLV